jgi:invasion protein IalB
MKGTANFSPNIHERNCFMEIRLLDSMESSARYLLAIGALVVSMTTTVMRVDAQQLVPFGDVPATENFSEAEIATRGAQPARPLTYAPWRKVCFKATQEAGSKMVCRTTINGKWDTGQIALRVDLIKREGDPAVRLQIFGPAGSFLQPGIKLTVDQGAPVQIPYVICLANGCVAGSVATASLIHDLEAGEMLALETVNSNVVGVTTSVPLKEFAEVYQGTPAQVFEQRLEGEWEQLGR